MGIFDLFKGNNGVSTSSAKLTGTKKARYHNEILFHQKKLSSRVKFERDKVANVWRNKLRESKTKASFFEILNGALLAGVPYLALPAMEKQIPWVKEFAELKGFKFKEDRIGMCYLDGFDE